MEQHQHDDSVSFYERCTSCGVPYTQACVDGGRCLACLSMICGETQEKIESRDWYTYIAAFLKKSEERDMGLRPDVKSRIFALTYSAHGVYTSRELAFYNLMEGLLVDPTDDRRRALWALGKTYLEETRRMAEKKGFNVQEVPKDLKLIFTLSFPKKT
jgi:hypothetical protein